ncbi:MAG: hypothetical protein QHI48_06650 [Bacteroidota bacterium]|nr:hypothetical protein [Bacteroidota bacterium]
MRTLYLYLFSLLTLAIPSLAAAQEAVFHAARLEEGMMTRENSERKRTMTLKIDEGAESEDIEINSTVTARKNETILALEDGAPRTLRVVFDEFTLVQSMETGETETQKRPTIGKAYIVEHGDTGILVHTEDGSPLTAGEEEFLMEEYDKMSPEHTFRRLFDGRTLRIGDKVDLGDERGNEFLQSISPSPAGEIADFSLTLRELRSVNGRECGVFDLAMSILVDNEQVAMQMKTKGEVIVERGSCLPVSLVIEGPMDLILTSEGLSLSGTGTVGLRSSYVYEPPAAGKRAK